MTASWLHSLSASNVFVIAEIGCNHNGSEQLAEELVRACAATGADAAKFQSFTPTDMITRTSPKAAYQVRATGNEESQYDRLCRMHLDDQTMLRMQRLCASCGIRFCSSPFDIANVAMLDSMDVPFFKIPSGEITNIPLLESIARCKRPVILSTGMSELHEIHAALDALHRNGATETALLHCVSDYPARWEDANLRAIPTLQKEFGLPVGFSDHTQGIEIPLLAVALGAVIIEKHITLDRTMEGGDHLASLEPDMFGDMVSKIRRMGSVLGDGVKTCRERERDVRDVARKSLVITRPVRQGEPFTTENIGCKRPGTGISPARYSEVLGHTATRDLPPEHQLQTTDIEQWNQKAGTDRA